MYVHQRLRYDCLQLVLTPDRNTTALLLLAKLGSAFFVLVAEAGIRGCGISVSDVLVN